VLPGFIGFVTTEYGWRGQTLAQSQTTYRMFIEVCGDLPLSSYERQVLTVFYDTLRALPALYSKDRRWRGMTLAQIVEASRDAEVERVTMKTVKRHFSALGRLFDYLKRRGQFTGENPARGFEYGKKGRARHGRLMWEKEPLRQLFASPVWTGCLSENRRSTPGTKIIKDERYWLPLLGVFHGNRLEEFAQLQVRDIRREDDIWFFDINDDGVKQVKNEQSKRRVPIHPAVIALGFLDYARPSEADPAARVFPLLRPGGPDNKLGYYFTKWFTRYRRDVGVYQKRLDYHSFRHGVTTKLAAARVSLDIRNELLGHEGESTDEQVYLKGLPLDQLREAIALVKWPELEPLIAQSAASPSEVKADAA
jgi:integrase